MDAANIDRSVLAEEIRRLLNDHDSISAVARALLLAWFDNGGTASELTRAIDWWKAD